ncbi:MAG TPA: CapA family protein [Candidatus Cybelea sp.]|nr:CapA family protein [Candidatus Cybelea sp.]
MPAATKHPAELGNSNITLFLSGDLMTGRGVDQVLPFPGDPRLHEAYVSSASTYVELAEAKSGPIPRPVNFTYVWGDGLSELRRIGPDARIVNLETSVTRSDSAWRKAINYKMNSANVPCLTAAGIQCCVLANNHVMDWGRSGLLDTLDALSLAGIATAGAGRNRRDAAEPAILPVSGKGRVLVFSFGSTSSGIPPEWAAGPDMPGLNLLPDLSQRTAKRIGAEMAERRQSGDVVVASVHWGSNWGYDVPPEQIAFAHALIGEAACDIVHGHSSHHAKAFEVYRGKLILYGCGDLLNDYEGIAGRADYRTDLSLMYFPTVIASSGRLARLVTWPFKIERFRLRHASIGDTAWLCDRLSREGASFGTRFVPNDDGAIEATWRDGS